MSKESLSYDDLLRIVDLIEKAARFSEFHLKMADVEIEVKTRTDGAPAAPKPQTPAAEPSQGGEVSNGAVLAPEVLAPAAAEPSRFPPGAVAVKSPMVGIFYRAPEPGAKPFVEIGSRVTPETTVCLIEVMKLISSIPAGVAGIVTHLLVENASPVEIGQPLVVIDSSA